MSYTIKCSCKEAVKLVNRKTDLKRIGYRVWVKAFMPIRGNETVGFPGMVSAKVTKKEFIRLMEDSIKHFEERGAMIELTVPDDDFQSFYFG